MSRHRTLSAALCTVALAVGLGLGAHAAAAHQV